MNRRPHEEQQFLDGYDASAYDRPSVSVDVVILTLREGHLQALLVKRKEHPFLNYWSLPGGLCRYTSR